MDDRVVYISLVSIVPTLLLCAYVYWKDRVEKEPASLLFGLFFGGAVCFLPAHYIIKLLSDAADKLFAGAMEVTVEGVVLFESNAQMYSHRIIYSFFCVALVSELLKWLVLVLLTRKNKSFNCMFDGMVYSVFVSMGFGVVENLRYAFTDGWDSLLLRLVSLAPGIFSYGVIMGLFYTAWFISKKAYDYERELKAKGIIDTTVIKRPWFFVVLSLIAPVAAHGMTAFAEVINSKTLSIINLVLMIVIYIISIFVVEAFSKHDGQTQDVVKKLIAKKHPELFCCEEVKDDE